MHTRLARWLWWEPTGLGPYETLRARLMSRVLIGLIGVVALSIPLQLTQPSSPILAAIPLLFVVQYVPALWLLWSGRQQAAASLIVGSSWLALAAILVPLGGIRGTTPLYIGMNALVAVTWLDPRRALIAVLLHVALLVGGWIATPQPAVPEWIGSPAELRFGLMVSATLSVTLVSILVHSTLEALHATSGAAERRASQAARAAERAKAASEAKSRFLATMSHELRTPLNAILGYSELLQDEGGPAVADLERIETAGRQLLTLVDEVLEMVRAEQAPRPTRPEPVDLRSLVEEQVDAIRPQIRADPELLLRDDARLVYTDRVYARRIVEALFTHTARHTGDGRIAVELSGDPQEIRLAVRGGPHEIPNTLRPLVFEPFVQLRQDLSVERAEVSLALAQRLARHLGGRIEVTSAAGRGEIFTLHLPVGAS